MNYSLFPNHYHLGLSPISPQYNQSATFYPYCQVPLNPFNNSIPYNPYQTFNLQQGWGNSYQTNETQRLNIILIAILILVSLDLVLVRPIKK